MGAHQSSGDRELLPEDVREVFNIDRGIALASSNIYTCHALAGHSIIAYDDPERTALQQKIAKGELTPEQDRALGVMLGNAIGDALGAPLEFSALRYGSTEVTDGLDQDTLWTKEGYNQFDLQPGQWTDDFSMASCIADSLLEHRGEWNPADCRLRFYLWWVLGYCNAFGFKGEPRGSVGLGGNIGEAIAEFPRKRSAYTEEGDIYTSGNGSIMRLSPVAVCFWRDAAKAMEVAYWSSRTTHRGEEAAECCRLLAYLCCELIRTGGGKKVLDRLPGDFESPEYSVNCLARGEAEARDRSNKGLDLKDRVWDWKNPEHRYCASRAAEEPDYVGSYAMDNLCMALHCCYTTATFEEAVLKCVNMRGDADSVAAVVGQIAGAMYGLSSIPKSWIARVQEWDRNGDIALKAARLFQLHQPA